MALIGSNSILLGGSEQNPPDSPQNQANLPPFSWGLPAAKSKQLTYGNKALAYGAIASELEFFSAYPMTPASTVLSEIVNSKKVNYIQAEDEIAVMNIALGASFT